MKIKITLYIALMFMMNGMTILAQQITWGPAQFMLGNNDISTTGVAFDAAAFNGSTQTVNGVTFNPLAASGTVGGFTGYSDGKIAANSPSGTPGPFTKLFPTSTPSSAAYSAVVSTLGFAYGCNGTVVISGLTIGHTYQIQVWSYFTASPGNSNTTLTGANTVTLIPDTGEFAIGTFTAAASSLTFNFNHGISYAAINALSVRDITTGGSAPEAPTGLAANVGNAWVNLNWAASSGATSYNVYRGTSANGESATPIATGITSTSYSDSSLSNGTTYFYKVTAVNFSGTSDYSNEVNATPTVNSGTGNLVLAVGLERIVPAYNGPAIRIQRPSDNTQLDIGFAAGSNALDTAAVSAFLGTSQGWITKLYSQDSSGHDVLAPGSTDNMPTICMTAPTAITISSTTYLTARNIKMPYGPNGSGNNRYFILPSSVSIDRSQASVFLAYRPDYSGGPAMPLYEIGDPTIDAVDLMSSASGFQGLTHNSTVTFANNNIVARCQPTVVGLVTSSNSAPTLYIDGVSHSSGGTIPTSAICSGGYLIAGTGAGVYGQSLYCQYNFLGFAIYNTTVDPNTAASISNSMIPRGIIPAVNIVADGDSITQGTGSIYGWDTLRYVEPLLNQPSDITNIAIYGTPSAAALGHITTPTPALSTIGLLYNSNYTANIYYLAIGTNDIHGTNGTGAGTWANVQQTLQDAKAMGYKTIVATIMHEHNNVYTETFTTSAEVENFNTLARNAYASHASYLDAIVDYDADPRLGNINSFYPTYTDDGVHPNDAGYQVMSSIAAPVFNSLIDPATKTYTQWANNLFSVSQLTDPSISGPAAIPQNDGISNLLKYLFDINPTLPMTSTDRAALPAVGVTPLSGSTYLTLTYRQNAKQTGLTINVQMSTDLANWSVVTPDNTVSVGTDSSTGDPLIQVQIKITPSSASKEFVRLQVTGS